MTEQTNISTTTTTTRNKSDCANNSSNTSGTTTMLLIDRQNVVQNGSSGSSSSSNSVLPACEIQIFSAGPNNNNKSTAATNGPSRSSSASLQEQQQQQQQKSLDEMPWFWGNLSREDEFELMRGQPDGTFLVRNSSVPGDYTVCLNHQGATKLIRIYQRNGRFGFQAGDDLPFGSVQDIVQFYRDRSLKQFNTNLDVTLKFPLDKILNSFYSYCDEDEQNSRTAIDKERLQHEPIEQILTKFTRTNTEYIEKMHYYDSLSKQAKRLEQELQTAEYGLSASNETLKLYEWEKELLEQREQVVQKHELSRWKESHELLSERCRSLKKHKARFECDVSSLKSRLNKIEGEILSGHPDLVPLAKQIRSWRRLLLSRGFSDESLAKLSDIRARDQVKKPAISADPSNISGNTTKNNKGPDYIPPDGILENSDYWLLKSDSTKQQALDFLLKPGSSASSSGSSCSTTTTTTTTNNSSNSQEQQQQQQQKSNNNNNNNRTLAEDGTFLIRHSERRPGFFALSVIYKQRVYNCLIERQIRSSNSGNSNNSNTNLNLNFYSTTTNTSGTTIINDNAATVISSPPPPPSSSENNNNSSNSNSNVYCNSKYGFEGTNQWFPSLVDLVKFYSYNSLKAHNPDLDVTLMYPALFLREQKQQ